MLRGLSTALVCIAAAGCGGAVDSNEPGADTYLGFGAIAVDPRTETAFVVSGDDGSGGKLWAVEADAGHARLVQDLGGARDLRLLFPTSGLLLMSEADDGRDTLTLLDHTSFAVKKTVTKPARYHGTRVSPSGRFLAVADNAAQGAPIHVVDTATLEHVVVPHDGEWLEAVWLNGTDTLVAIVFYETRTPRARARLLTWSLGADAPLPPAERWATPDLDVRVDGVEPPELFSATAGDAEIHAYWTRIGVHPGDADVVFPTMAVGGPRLVLLDPARGTTRFHDGASGPVGFSPDGSSILAYSFGVGDAPPPVLLVIDRARLEAAEVVLPYRAWPEFFVSGEGNLVVIAPTWVESGDLALYDLDNGIMSRVRGARVHLQEFVSRPGHGELWLVEKGLFRFDYLMAELEAIALDWQPDHVAILPQRDQLALDDRGGRRLVFWSPQTRTVVRSVALGGP